VDSGLARLTLVLAAGAAAAVGMARAQEGPQNAAPVILPSTPPPTIQIPPAETPAPPAIVNEATPAEPKALRPAPVKHEAPARIVPAPGPPAPIRSPTAIMRVLDKVTAETLRFEAPVGRRVRYKTLIFMVKVCETRGVIDPEPRPSAYLVIDSEPPAPPGLSAPPAREIYKGWMFANSPGLHPFEHPVYDAWLEGCTAATPPA
jgi:hypothetical protein